MQKGRNVLKLVIGKLGRHGTSNGNGIRAINFVNNNNNNNNNNNTIIGRYILATHNIQKRILQSPATRTNNQIDRVLVDGRHTSINMM